MRRVLGALAALVVWACFGIAVPAGAVGAGVPAIGPVPAHSELRSVTPANGATLGALPAQVVLVFSEDVNPSFVTVALTNGGASVALGAPAVTGPTVTAAVPPGAGAGAYRIAYRVVSKDGHPISGASEFTVAAAATTPPLSTPAPAVTTETAGRASATVAATPVAAEPASTSSSATTVLGVVGVVVLIAAGGAVLAWRRRRDSA